MGAHHAHDGRFARLNIYGVLGSSRFDALVLADAGRRENGRWKRGSVHIGESSNIAVLDHAPHLAARSLFRNPVTAARGGRRNLRTSRIRAVCEVMEAPALAGRRSICGLANSRPVPQATAKIFAVEATFTESGKSTWRNALNQTGAVLDHAPAQVGTPAARSRQPRTSGLTG